MRISRESSARFFSAKTRQARIATSQHSVVAQAQVMESTFEPLSSASSGYAFIMKPLSERGHRFHSSSSISADDREIKVIFFAHSTNSLCPIERPDSFSDDKC